MATARANAMLERMAKVVFVWFFMFFPLLQHVGLTDCSFRFKERRLS